MQQNLIEKLVLGSRLAVQIYHLGDYLEVISVCITELITAVKYSRLLHQVIRVLEQ